MSADAIVMMLVAMTLLWGGLALATVNLVRQGAVEDRGDDRPERLSRDL